MPSTPTKVYPIPGRFVVGERMEVHEVESKAEADRLVGTGAFALSEKEANEQAYTTPVATPVKESAEEPAAAEE